MLRREIKKRRIGSAVLNVSPKEGDIVKRRQGGEGSDRGYFWGNRDTGGTSSDCKGLEAGAVQIRVSKEE